MRRYPDEGVGGDRSFGMLLRHRISDADNARHTDMHRPSGFPQTCSAFEGQTHTLDLSMGSEQGPRIGVE
jgi:hypothetical protein